MNTDDAQLLRWAEQQGYTFEWADDWDLGGSHVDYYGPGSAYEATPLCGCTKYGRHVWDDPTAARRTCEACGETAGEPSTCETCDMRDANGHIVDSLGCIDDASEEYRREVEANMAREIYPAWLKAQRRSRSTQRARRRHLKRSVRL